VTATTPPAIDASIAFPRVEVATHVGAIAAALEAYCQAGPAVSCAEYLALLEVGEGVQQLLGALERLQAPPAGPTTRRRLEHDGAGGWLAGPAAG
jgi:hypothetical protein